MLKWLIVALALSWTAPAWLATPARAAQILASSTRPQISGHWIGSPANDEVDWSASFDPLRSSREWVVADISALTCPAPVPATDVCRRSWRVVEHRKIPMRADDTSDPH